MIIIIAGASHTGKTALAQRLLEKYSFPYLSIDHLKMGLIRSGNTSLTPMSEHALLTGYLWKIVREIIKTALENDQNLIVEGCYVPFDWQKDFDEAERARIRYCCLIMTEKYILNHAHDIKAYESIIEKRAFDEYSPAEALRDNAENLLQCKKYKQNYILIDEAYRADIEI